MHRGGSSVVASFSRAIDEDSDNPGPTSTTTTEGPLDDLLCGIAGVLLPC